MQTDYDAIKSRIRLSSLVRQYVPSLKQLNQDTWRGLCPFHQEKTASFIVHDDTGYCKCFGCIQEDELVWTSRGLLRIRDVSIGDRVLGLDGKWNNVIDVESKEGDVFEISTHIFREGLKLTKDHTCIKVGLEEALNKLYFLRKESAGIKYYSRFRSHSKNMQDSVVIDECNASEVNPGDYLLFPVIPDADRNNETLYDDSCHRYPLAGRKPRRVYGLPVNEDTAWLYGMYLAEGSCSGRSVFFSLHADEAETFGNRIQSIIKDNFGFESTIHRYDKRKNNCDVTCSSTELVSHISRWFGKGCDGKKIPSECLGWTKELQRSLMRGYFDGDGNTDEKHVMGSKLASTVSRYLAYGMFSIGVQCGVVTSVSRIKTGMSGGVKKPRRKTWSIGIRSRQGIEAFYTTIRGVEYLFMSVSKIGDELGVSKVVDISTDGTNSFCTKLGVVHNCGEGGDCISFLEKMEMIPHAEAVKRMKAEAGIEDYFLSNSQKKIYEVEKRNRIQKMNRFRSWRSKLISDLVDYTNAQWKIYRTALKQLRITDTEELSDQAQTAMTEAVSREKALDSLESMPERDLMEWYDTIKSWESVKPPRWYLTGWRKALLSKGANV